MGTDQSSFLMRNLNAPWKTSTIDDFFVPGFFNLKKPHDMVSFSFAGFGLFRNVHFLKDKELAWNGISWLPRPWELDRILWNFIFYVNIASKLSSNEFHSKKHPKTIFFFFKKSRASVLGWIIRFPAHTRATLKKIFV